MTFSVLVSSLTSSFFSSCFFKTPAGLVLVLVAGLAIAAALAAATLSAAAEGFTGAVVLAARLAVAEAELLPEVVRVVAEAELLPEVVLAVAALLPGPTFFRLSSGFDLAAEVVVAGLLEAVGLDKPGLDLVLEA